MAESAVRLYVPDSPELILTVQRHLHKQYEELAGQIAGGYAVDWSDYKRRVGVLEGLTFAMDMCRQQFEELTK